MIRERTAHEQCRYSGDFHSENEVFFICFCSFFVFSFNSPRTLSESCLTNFVSVNYDECEVYAQSDDFVSIRKYFNVIESKSV